MALPNYGASDSASQYLSRNQIQRQRRQERRQNKRQRQKVKKITSGWGPPEEDPGYTDGPVAGGSTPVDDNYSEAVNYPGFQGQYVAPENSYEHPFYSPGATYARPGELHYQVPQNSQLQQTYIEQNPAAGYYGWAANNGYGGLDARSQTVQGMYKDFATAYEASKAYNNFEGNWQDFMDMQDVPHLLEQMTNQQMGIDNSQFRGRDRWSLRGN